MFDLKKMYKKVILVITKQEKISQEKCALITMVSAEDF